MNTDITEILDDCIDRLLKGESLEDCLARYPESAAELEPLLHTAGAIFKVSQLSPDAARKEAAKRRFLEVADKKTPARRGVLLFPLRNRAIAASLAAALLLVLAMAGAMVASADSTPDDPLYSVKRATEWIQFLLVRDDDGETSLHIELADRRLSELEVLTNRRSTIRVDLVMDMMNETDEAVTSLDRAENKARLGDELLTVTSRQQEVLRRAAARAEEPEGLKTGLNKALERSRDDYNAVSTAIAKNKPGRRPDDNREDGLRPATASPTSTRGLVSPTIANPIAVASSSTDSSKDEDEGGDDKREERGQTPDARGGAPDRRGDDDLKPSPTIHPTLPATPTRISTPRPKDLTRGATPTATAVRKSTDSSDDGRTSSYSWSGSRDDDTKSGDSKSDD